jgi:hypothetical protein
MFMDIKAVNVNYTQGYQSETVANPEISKRGWGLQKGRPTPEIAKQSRILDLKSCVLLTFDGKFRTKKGGGEGLGTL